MEFKDLFNYGVPTGLLAIVAFALWRILTWLKTDVVVPVVKSHLKLIDTLQEHIPKQTDAITAQSDIQEKIVKLSQENADHFAIVAAELVEYKKLDSKSPRKKEDV